LTQPLPKRLEPSANTTRLPKGKRGRPKSGTTEDLGPFAKPAAMICAACGKGGATVFWEFFEDGREVYYHLGCRPRRFAPSDDVITRPAARKAAKQESERCFKHGNDKTTCRRCKELSTKDYSDHAGEVGE